MSATETGVGTSTETIAESQTDIRIDEGDHERFAHYVDRRRGLVLRM